MNLVKLIQDSPEWHAWRLGGIGASEIAAVRGEDKYQSTPYSTWLVKTKRAKGFEGNSATQHGKETEAKARARYELITMEDVQPACAIHPEYPICLASLDGIRDDGKLILELKCPTGRDTIDQALAKKVPDHYWSQVQYQLAVTGAEMCHFFVYHEESGEHALVEVLPDVSYQGELFASALDFWKKYVLTDTPPPLIDKDVKVINDNPDLKSVCSAILDGHKTMAKERLDALKKVAIQIGGHSKIRCGRVQIATVKKNGAFSYYKLTVQAETA